MQENQDQPRRPPSYDFYAEANEQAERLGMGRPFGGGMSPLEFHLVLGRMTLEAIKQMADTKIDHSKILQAVIEHFIESEGTDHLGSKGPIDLPWFMSKTKLTPEEVAALEAARDKARTVVGWLEVD